MRLNYLPEHVDIIPINSRYQQTQILSQLRKFLDLDEIKQNHVFLEPKSVPQLQLRPHCVTFNTGKCIFWMFLTKSNNRQCTYLFDKSMHNFWLIKSRFAMDYYKGSLFEVNLFSIKNSSFDGDADTFEEHLLLSDRSKNHLLVLIHSMWLHSGRSLARTTTGSRHELTVETFKNSQYSFNNYDFIEYNFKPYFTYQYIESAWFDYRPQTNYSDEIHGLLFCPQEVGKGNRGWPVSYLLNVAENVKRPKRIVQITRTDQPINFLVRKTGNLDNYQLYLQDKDHQLKFVDIALINDLSTSKLLQNLLKMRSEAVFVCQYDHSFQKWKPVEISDREAPDILTQFSEKRTF